jgi:hypothetical protein
MIAALMLTLAVPQAAPQPPLLIERKAEERPQLLILGSPHLANNNRDVVNTKIGDVTTPERQREIVALVDALARFRPTHVAIEWKTKDQTGLDKRYADYRAGRYTLSANERDQIGLRLAAKLGLPRVDAVDWNDVPPGTEADWDYAAWAEANGMKPRFDAMRANLQAEVAGDEARMACTAIPDWYRHYNTADMRSGAHRRYYDFALLGGVEHNPGANWLGSWYGRNMKIFANLVRIAPKPTDRVLVLYGFGHSFLLDEYARQSGAFAVADALDYLPAAKPSSCR